MVVRLSGMLGGFCPGARDFPALKSIGSLYALQYV
jgi:hypothetical protein